MHRFANTPDSPPAGSSYKLCYDFTGLPSGITQITATATYPDGSTETVTIKRGGDNTGCVNVTAPEGQTGVTWTDDTGNSTPHGIIFS